MTKNPQKNGKSSKVDSTTHPIEEYSTTVGEPLVARLAHLVPDPDYPINFAHCGLRNVSADKYELEFVSDLLGTLRIRSRVHPYRTIIAQYEWVNT